MARERVRQRRLESQQREMEAEMEAVSRQAGALSRDAAKVGHLHPPTATHRHHPPRTTATHRHHPPPPPLPPPPLLPRRTSHIHEQLKIKIKLESRAPSPPLVREGHDRIRATHLLVDAWRRRSVTTSDRKHQ